MGIEPNGFPACSIMPQPTTLLRAPEWMYEYISKFPWPRYCSVQLQVPAALPPRGRTAGTQVRPTAGLDDVQKIHDPLQRLELRSLGSPVWIQVYQFKVNSNWRVEFSVNLRRAIYTKASSHSTKTVVIHIPNLGRRDNIYVYAIRRQCTWRIANMKMCSALARLTLTPEYIKLITNMHKNAYCKQAVHYHTWKIRRLHHDNERRIKYITVWKWHAWSGSNTTRRRAEQMTGKTHHYCHLIHQAFC
jgi:hypothetical protein